jgi:hypothetical protein
MSLKFTDLPADVDKRGTFGARRWVEEAAELRKNPGKWAILAEDEYSQTAQKIMQGYYVELPAGEFEAKAADTYSAPSGTGKSKTTKARRIYVRYVGKKVEPEAAKPEPRKLPAADRLAAVKPPMAPIDMTARGIARYHAARKGIDWTLIPVAERGRREEIAIVAFRAVYDLIADDMERHVHKKRA